MLKKVKQWLTDFDIKPKPPVVGSMIDAAQESISNGDIAQAIKTLKKALIINRTNKTVLELLSKLYLDYSQYKNCENLLRFCIRHYPDEPLFLRYRGTLYCLMGKNKSGIKDLKKALSFEPNDALILHLLQAASGDISKNTNPDYVKDLFDAYADNFEQSLNALKYSGPDNLISYVSKEIGTQFNNILDLGCGTGLLGMKIQEIFKYHKLVGIDLSSEMLKKAIEKDIYHEAYAINMIDYLRENNNLNKYDLIVSSDVFMYIGDLSELFALVSKNLNNNRYFVFTVENNHDGKDYAIDITGRFKHSSKYITNTLKKSNLRLITHKQEVLRYERGQPVSCYMYISCKF